MILPTTSSCDVVGALHAETPRIADILRLQLEFFNSARFYLTIKVGVRQAVKDKTDETSFAVCAADLLQTTNIEEELYNQIEAIGTKIDNYTRNGSGWVIDKMICAHLNITKYSPMRVGKHIPLPAKIKNKRCLLNIQNDDNQDEVARYLREKLVSQRLDPLIYWKRNHKTFPNLSKLVRVYLCPPPSSVASERAFKVAKNVVGDRRLSMRPENLEMNMFLKYNLRALNYSVESLQSVPETFGCPNSQKRDPRDSDEGSEDDSTDDFEAYIKPIPEDGASNLQATAKVKEHKPCGFAYKVVTPYADYKKSVVVYRDDGTCDVAERFILEMHEEYERLHDLIWAEEAMIPLTSAQLQSFNSARTCYLCHQPFAAEKRVKDHCHYTRSTEKRLPILFHNFKGYDVHMLIKALAKHEDYVGNIEIIPNSMEKYVSVRTRKFRLIDSMQHLSAPLDKLVKNLLNRGADNLKLTKEYINTEHGDSERKFELLTRKGVYPYSYIDQVEKFDQDLPEQHIFHNDLTNEPLSNDDYAHVQEIWNEFDMRNLGDLHDLYVVTDVLLLADVLEQYREMCWDRMGLEALCYISLPSLTFDACLKLTKKKLQIVKDIDLLQMLETGIRGGISVISHRHAVANNPLLRDFDPTVPESYLLYIDANNLYGYAMSEKVPIDEIGFVNESTVAEWTTQDIIDMDASGDYSYIFEVDIEIPEEIHDQTSDYPLCPEKLEITKDMLSPKSWEMRVQRGCGRDFNSTKLAPNFFPKKAYVTHLRNLQFCLSQGAKLTKIRRVIHFRQEAWIAPYIAENTRLRQQAADEFERDYYKLLNNAFFGKTMENVRRRVKIVLVNNEKSHAWQTSKPQFKRFQIFNEELVGVELSQTNITLDKPIYVGFTVLELSKLLMYKFHYDVMKPNFPDSVLCFTDTDSFLYHIKCSNLYSVHLNRLREHFDFSKYPEDHFLFSDENRAVVGKFKDETDSVPIREFIGLRSKCYSLLTCTGKQKNTAAGVKKCVKDKELNHELYRKVLKGPEMRMLSDQSLEDHFIHQMTFRSHDHTVYTVDQYKYKFWFASTHSLSNSLKMTITAYGIVEDLTLTEKNYQKLTIAVNSPFKTELLKFNLWDNSLLREDNAGSAVEKGAGFKLEYHYKDQYLCLDKLTGMEIVLYATVHSLLYLTMSNAQTVLAVELSPLKNTRPVLTSQ
ncbi:hypothetical protein ACHWQZ_G004350 [Mnemiopsis leidyi]